MKKSKSISSFLLPITIGAILGCIIGVVLHFYPIQIEEFSSWQRILLATG